MELVGVYRQARRDEYLARLRRVLALRAMSVAGLSQAAIARELGLSQPAISQQLTSAGDLSGVDAETILQAGSPIIKVVAAAAGFTDLAVFGSVARHQATPDSDIDILAQPPQGATIEDLTRLRATFEHILGRPVDVVSYGGLRRGIDDDILRESVPL